MARSLERDCLELLVASLESLREFSAVLVDKRDTYSESERFLGDVSEQLLVGSQQVEKIEDLVSQRHVPTLYSNLGERFLTPGSTFSYIYPISGSI